MIILCFDSCGWKYNNFILRGTFQASSGCLLLTKAAPNLNVLVICALQLLFIIFSLPVLSVAGLVQTLRNPNGSYTMFAPTDSALKSLSYQSGESDNRCTVSMFLESFYLKRRLLYLGFESKFYFPHLV